MELKSHLNKTIKLCTCASYPMNWYSMLTCRCRWSSSSFPRITHPWTPATAKLPPPGLSIQPLGIEHPSPLVWWWPTKTTCQIRWLERRGHIINNPKTSRYLYSSLTSSWYHIGSPRNWDPGTCCRRVWIPSCSALHLISTLINIHVSHPRPLSVACQPWRAFAWSRKIFQSSHNSRLRTSWHCGGFWSRK